MMETLERNIETLSVTIRCDYDTAFSYLAVPLNQKEWAVHFFLDIEEKDGQTIAHLPFGQLPMHVLSYRETGVLDIYLGEGNPTRTRLIQIEEGLCEYTFTLAQPKGMPNVVWEQEALPNMKDELHRLKTILENR